MTVLSLITTAAIVGSLNLGIPLSETTAGTASSTSASIPSPISTSLACGSAESGRMGPCGRAGCSGRDQYCTSYVVFNFLGFTLYRHCTGTMQGVQTTKLEWN